MAENRRVRLDPTPDTINIPEHMRRTSQEILRERVGEGPFLIQGYDKNSLPDATEWGSISPTDPFTSIIFVWNETGGETLAYSDGTDWRRVSDRAIVT